MSSASSIRETLVAYVAGHVGAERVVTIVGDAYYRDPRGRADGMRPLVEVIERAAPGVVTLGGSSGRPGFDVKLAERPFPRAYEAELRRAAEAYLAAEPDAPPSVSRGFVGRLLTSIRRIFTSSR